MKNTFDGLSNDRRIFPILVAFRWASLIPALWLVWQPGAYDPVISASLVLIIAAGFALLIMLFHGTLNDWLVRRPYLLGVDLFIVAGLLAVSGGTRSPYYLYALSPLLAGAFFFQLRGAVLVAAAFTPLYLLSLLFAPRLHTIPPDSSQFFSQLAGIWLIPVLFGYPSLLLKRLRSTSQSLNDTHDELTQQNEELEKANRQLRILHDLTILLQAAPDIATVQDRVLKAVIDELGFPYAVVGLVDPVSQTLGDWQAYPADRSSPSRAVCLPLEATSGLLVSSMLEQRKGKFAPEQVITSDTALNEWLGKRSWLSLPLNLREHAVGVLLVATGQPSLDESRPDLMADQEVMLDVVASQAAVALGTTMVCIDRTRRLTVEQERNRIARDIHDTVSQSLFGIVFTLDACVEMLPGQADEVKGELLELRELASGVRNEVRRSIFDLWPAELDLERFKTDLVASASQCCRPMPFQVEFSTSGDFEGVPAPVRRTLYRVAQEALSNAARHAGVSNAQVRLDIGEDRVHLEVSDQGCGFDPRVILSRGREQGRFGLPGIQERIKDLGGTCEILSQVNKGTSLLSTLPMHQGDVFDG